MDNQSCNISFAGAAIAAASDMRVVGCNEEASRLTGAPATSALGRPCWEVLGACDASGAAVCGPSRALFNSTADGDPIVAREVVLGPCGGGKTVTLSTVVLAWGAHRLLLHLLPGVPHAEDSPPLLTPRQREVLALLMDGLSTRAVAQRLVIEETTVNNH